jgi:ABC-type multidrug transport system permease subunit
MFRTGWLGAIAIGILAAIIFIIISIILAALLGVTIPSQFFPKI